MYSSSETRPLTGPSYDKYRKEGLVRGPSVSRIIQIFGTWRSECELAGVPSEEPVRSDYMRGWTDEELLDQLAQFLLDSESETFQSFDEWCRLDESRASVETLRN